MVVMNHWAVIPSGARLDMLMNLVKQLTDDNVKVVIVNTGYYEAVLAAGLNKIAPTDTVVVLNALSTPRNISRWWNQGLDYVADKESAADEYIVAVLNDDIEVPSEFVQKLGHTLLGNGAAVAYPDQHRYFMGQVGWHVHKKAEPVSLFMRISGYAFALRGSAKLRADESLVWWYGDDDLDWRGREAGGSVLVGGLMVKHFLPNSTTTGDLAEQAGRDRQTFKDKWGKTPW